MVFLTCLTTISESQKLSKILLLTQWLCLYLELELHTQQYYLCIQTLVYKRGNIYSFQDQQGHNHPVIPLVFKNNKKYSIELIFRPSVPDNVTNMRVFDDDD